LIKLDVECWGSVASPELSIAQAAEIASTQIVDVRAAPGMAGWVLSADSRVGVAIGDNWDLRVRPRLDVPRLLFLLAYAADPTGWRNVLAPFHEEDDLLSAVASGFSWHAQRATDQGLLRGYLNIDDRIPTVRGRIRFRDQIARQATLPLPVEVSYDEFTADIAENRMLKTAAVVLLRLPRVPKLARKRLLRLRAALDEVSFIDRPREATAPAITRLNKRYEPALRLAELILRNASITTTRGAVTATGFSFDMNKVFEEFVTVAFTESMRRHGGTVRAQVSEHSLDLGRKLALKPDISWWMGDSCRAILDAKYKAIEGGRLRHPDAYQMLAYCTAYGLPRGYLIYADDSAIDESMHVVRNAGTEIVVFEVGVKLEPDALLGKIDQLADMVAGQAPPLVAGRAEAELGAITR
jgi:5-methylcytosine-specific restriction enzyme subunit McrC